ncbi:low-density lipoprotein receptor class A domain-containing protein 4 isoform X2 [Esox lucius]|nr:low-density lipoprotein receptor class A domain-containing protein 4 isoform X2 [Esox lucius]
MVVMTVVVVVICLLNHYKLSALAFFSRRTNSHTQDGQQDQNNTQLDGCVWPSDCLVTEQETPEVMYRPRLNQERFNPPSFMQRERFSRFQPTYPYLQQDIDLPPTICLSDGEELPPYQGPCALQLRDPEQQLELSRASIRAPPNRTIFHSDLMDVYVQGGAPRPPSSNSGVSAVRRMDGSPPTYSEVMGHYPGSSAFQNQYSNNESLDQQIKDRTVTDIERDRHSYNKSTSTTGSSGSGGVKEVKDNVSDKVKEKEKDRDGLRVKPV